MLRSAACFGHSRCPTAPSAPVGGALANSDASACAQPETVPQYPHRTWVSHSNGRLRKPVIYPRRYGRDDRGTQEARNGEQQGYESGPDSGSAERNQHEPGLERKPGIRDAPGIWDEPIDRLRKPAGPGGWPVRPGQNRPARTRTATPRVSSPAAGSPARARTDPARTRTATPRVSSPVAARRRRQQVRPGLESGLQGKRVRTADRQHPLDGEAHAASPRFFMPGSSLAAVRTSSPRG